LYQLFNVKVGCTNRASKFKRFHSSNFFCAV
jgi:hypothetical protein